jgi:DNA invertase Pin-like site-specific DNA recombinase
MNEWIGKNNKAMAILRVSSRRQEGNTSHETQENKIKEYCKENNLNLVDTARLVESAKDSGARTKYKAAIKNAIKTNIRHVVFYMYDRETRNLIDNEQNEKYIREDKLVIHYANDNKVLHAGSSDSDFFVRDINAVANKNFIRNLRTKTMDAMKTKAKSGWFPSNHVPLGYALQKLKDSSGKELKRGSIIVPDPNINNVNWVQREFELRAQGYSYSQIQKTCLDEGLVSVNKTVQYGLSSIERRLKNKFYAGYFDWQGIEYKGNHELIIPQKILDAVSDNPKGKLVPFIRKDAPFGGGWLKCAEPSCRCNIVYDPKKKKVKETGEVKTFPYYHCTNSKKVHVTQKGMNVSEGKIWGQLESAIDAMTITKQMADDISKALNETHLKVKNAHKREIEGFELALDAIDNKRDRTFDLFTNGTIDQENYKRQDERLKEERRHYTKQLAQATDTINGAYLETSKSILELATTARAQYLRLTLEERRALFDKILSNPVLDETTVRYAFQKPYAVLCEMKQKDDWRSQRDSNQHLLQSHTSIILI